MNSKNKKIKEPGADKNLFNMIRDYCKAPWISINKELPMPNKLLLLAYYGGEDIGYKTEIGWLCKHVIKKHDKKKDNDWFLSKRNNNNDYCSLSSSYFERIINVNNSDNHKKESLLNSTINEREDDLSSKYEIIEENGEKIALVWFLNVTGGLPGIFNNYKSADSTFCDDLNLLMSAEKNYTEPDFWMYIPDIK